VGLEGDGRIRWRCHLRSSPEAVFRLLDTAEGRARFWAEHADERDGVIELAFSNGQTLAARILRREPPTLFEFNYFNDSTARFELEPDGAGGTELTFTEEGLGSDDLLENLPGWVSVLLGLKAAADFGIDLRNHDPSGSWERGYIDV
jgi:uncharacterized protein YndB with AHSA1/START domain